MSDVDGYISNVDQKLQTPFKKLRALVKKALPEASESIKWGVPYYTLNGVGVVSIAEYTNHVNLYFMQGAKLSSRLLKGTGKGMRHVTVERSATIDEVEIGRLLREVGTLSAATPRKTRRQTT